MAKRLRIWLGMALLALLVGVVGATDVASETAVAPQTAVVPQTSLAPTQSIPAGYALMGENEQFQLYANAETLAFHVVDRRSGYVWRSNLDEVTEEDRLNRTWTAFARSGVSIDYLDQTATSRRASVTNAERVIAFEPVAQGFAAEVTFTEPGITLLLRVTLEAHGARVEIPFAGIRQEKPEFRLGLLYVYPFFGATKADTVPGYMFIPDGSGSLIEFAASTKAKNMFYGRYYGADLGMITALPYDPSVKRPYPISIPVIGMAHQEQHAYIAIVGKGAAYGEVQAHPAGIITQFNFLHNAFIYNQSYFQATNRAGAGVTTLQPATNTFDVTLHYRFLTGAAANYVGMAQEYQRYLVEQGALQPLQDGDGAIGDGAIGDGAIGIRLEFLGSEKEKMLLWHRAIPMTTVAQMDEILAQLALPSPEVVYYGWQPLGAATMPPRALRLERRLGTVRELAQVVERVQALPGGHFSLYLDPQAALLDERGYSTRRDLALSITNFNLTGYNRNKVNHYLNLEALRARYNRLNDSLSDQLAVGWALDGIGATLYSDFKRGHVLNREEAIAQYQALLGADGRQHAFYLPNDYLFGLMRAYYDIPLGDNGYLYTTEAVPFLPIVLAGYVPYYGRALNFSANLRADLLRHVDYGAYPAYFLSQEATAKILNTSSSWIYTSSFAQWGAEVTETYQWLNSLLGPVEGARMVARQRLAPGVMATSYSNGRQIIVNYNETPFAAAGLFINAQDAIVQEAQP